MKLPNDIVVSFADDFCDTLAAFGGTIVHWPQSLMLGEDGRRLFNRENVQKGINAHKISEITSVRILAQLNS